MKGESFLLGLTKRSSFCSSYSSSSCFRFLGSSSIWPRFCPSVTLRTWPMATWSKSQTRQDRYKPVGEDNANAVVIREVVSHLDNSLSSGLACSADICLVENTWKITKLKAKNQYFIHFKSFHLLLCEWAWWPVDGTVLGRGTLGLLYFTKCKAYYWKKEFHFFQFTHLLRSFSTL